MASELEIWNGALQKLGATRVTSTSEGSRNALSCLACFSRTRDSELEDHPWSFAIKRASLAASATTPVYGKANSFPLPADFLRLANPDELDNDGSQDFQIEGRAIVTDWSGPLRIRYVARITDTGIWPPLFSEAVMAKMSREMCEEITQSNTKKVAADTDYKEVIGRAKHSNAIQRIAAQPPTDRYISVRD